MTNDIVRNTESNPSPAKTGKIKLYFFWCLLVILSLVAMEIFSFAIIRLTRNKGPYRDRVGQVRNPYHPYLGYVHAPNFTLEISKGPVKGMKLVTDENGYSVTPAYAYAHPDMTVVVTGGSTIFGIGSSDNSTTVPSDLERLINERLNIKAEVINIALRGGKSFQEMLLVDRFLAENHADLVLAVSGLNEAGGAIDDPTVEGAFLGKYVWDNAVALVHKAERGEFMLINLGSKLRSWSYTYDLLYRQFDKFKKKGKSQPPAEPPEFDLRREAPTSIGQRAKIAATHYAATDQISRMNGARFVMILQPTPRYKTNWTEEEVSRITRRYESKDMMRTYGEKEREFFDAFRETEKPFQFVDLSNIFSDSKETLYIDHCHYNDLAAEKLAEKILESVQPLLHK
jgi:lysophospholipase L1-like esterase